MVEHQARSKSQDRTSKKRKVILNFAERAWTYGGIAVRICQELGLNKESVLASPITLPDGSIDYVAMALRRRIFWSCLCIDK